MTKPKKLNLLMLIALVAGNMVGSGVYLLPSALASIGSISILSWVATSMGALFLAITFAKLSSLIPKTGGPYAYTREAFGDFIGFQTAFNYWITLWVGISGIAVAATGYLRIFFPALHNPKTSCITAISLIWAVTFINIIGVRKAGLIQLITTILKFIPLLLIIVLGFWFFHGSYITQSFNLSGHSNIHALSSGATLTLWAFIGLEAATVPAGSVENPKRNIPLATIIGTIIAAVVYTLSSTAIMGMIPAHILAQSTSPFADAAAVIFGPIGRTIIGLGAVISCVGALNGWTLLQGQISMAMAENKLFPQLFAKKNMRGVPAKGMIATSILISLILLLTSDSNLIHQFDTIILIATLSSLIPYFYTAIGALLLYKKYRTNLQSTVKYAIIAIVGGIYSFWAIIGTGQTIITYGAMIVILSLPIYTWIRLGSNLQTSKQTKQL